MQVYTYSEARQKLAVVLEQAANTGKVLIRRKDGQTFALVPEKAASSPLDVPSIKAKITTQELVDIIREGRERQSKLLSCRLFTPSKAPLTLPPINGVRAASATARSPKAFATAIRADLGETEAYKEALHKRGEIGLQRPMGANVRGSVDFITAVKNLQGNDVEIVITDVKTTTAGRKSPKPKTYIPGTWQVEVRMLQR